MQSVHGDSFPPFQEKEDMIPPAEEGCGQASIAVDIFKQISHTGASSLPVQNFLICRAMTI